MNDEVREMLFVAASEWWGQVLLKQETGFEQFRRAGYMNGSPDSAYAGLMGGGLVSMILERSGPVTAEQGAVFVENLANLLRAQSKALALEGWERWGTSISTDYHPCRMLSQAAEGLGIKNLDLHLPWKTYMRITYDCLEVAHEIMWQTKRDAIERELQKRLSAWMDTERKPPRWQAMGYDGPGSWSRADSEDSEVPATDEERESALAFWADDDVAHRAMRECIDKLPFHPAGRFEEIVDAILAAAIASIPSVLGIERGKRYVDVIGEWEIESVKEDVVRSKLIAGTPGEPLLAERVRTIDIPTFTCWWKDRGGSLIIQDSP